MKKALILTASAAAAAAAMTVVLLVLRLSAPAPGQQPVIRSFEDCVQAGNPVMESYPEQCRTAEGKLFVKPSSPSAGGTVPAAVPLPADSSEPAAGICAPAPADKIVVVAINPDAPSPRCQIIEAGQILRVHNNTAETVRVWFGGDEGAGFDIPAGGSYQDTLPVERSLEPGAHVIHGAPYQGPEVWFKPMEAAGSGFSFTEYPADEFFHGEPAPVGFDTYPQALNFRSRIIEGATAGPNFAGRYTIIEWGCGTSCQMHIIVDAVNGNIVAYDLPSTYGLEFRLDSRLLIVNPESNIPAGTPLPPGATTDHYEIRDRELLLLDSRPPDPMAVSGVRGLVLIGPTCPVVRLGEEDKCADRPYMTKLEVSERGGQVVEQLSTDTDGKFSLELPPGDYVISLPEPRPIMPRLEPTEFSVTPGRFTEITLTLDSGIR